MSDEKVALASLLPPHGRQQRDRANDSFLTASESSLKPYAETYFEYDSDHRISEFWGNGQCGCSGAGNGTHTIDYVMVASLGLGSGYSNNITAKGILAISTSGTSTSLASWVSTGSADPIAALHASTGGVKKFSTSIYDESGTQLDESRSYFLVPSSGAAR